MNASTLPYTPTILTHRVQRHAGSLRSVGALLVLAVGIVGAGSVALTLLPRQAQAQALRSPANAESVPSGITVIGEGVVRATPDTITLRLGIEQNAQTASAALSQT